jgi:hypothetical protein
MLRVVCFVGDFVLEDPRRSSSSSLTRNVYVVASFFSSNAVVSFHRLELACLLWTWAVVQKPTLTSLVSRTTKGDVDRPPHVLCLSYLPKVNVRACLFQPIRNETRSMIHNSQIFYRNEVARHQIIVDMSTQLRPKLKAPLPSFRPHLKMWK